MSEILWAWQCPLCKIAVEHWADPDHPDRKILWLYCERCKMHVDFIRLPGGYFNNRVEVAKEREK